ncbi:MAG: group 1 truncated hemoglobin [Xanthomonadaceae bacterium]|nr:group 1 truncated hemoglobin [Xanthomonadaceae bacterium]
MSQNASEASLFERIGGAPAVGRMVGQFYRSVFADPILRPYFEGVELSKLEHMQSEFFSAALGGPDTYGGRTMHHAHQGLHIRPEHFKAFVQHLFETLKDYGLTEDERYAIIAHINTYADDVFDSGIAPTE